MPGPSRTPQALTHTLALDDPHVLLAALQGDRGRTPPAHPLPVHTVNGGLRLLELWTSGNALVPPYAVGGAVVDPGPGPAADGAADLLPEGVFALDRLGLITYVNPRAAELLGRPRPELLGRPLWQAVPWLDQPSYADHLRGALLSPEPVHFQVARPSGAAGHLGGPRRRLADDVRVSRPRQSDLQTDPHGAGRGHHGSPEAAPLHGRPAANGSGIAEPATGITTTALYQPIVLAIALTEAVTARQVSETVMRELLPAFGGRRLAIYLLQDRRLYLAWETGFPQGFLAPFDGVGLDAKLPGVETLTTGRPLFFESMPQLAAAYPGIPLTPRRVPGPSCR